MSKTYHMSINVEHMAHITKKEFDHTWQNVFSDKGKLCTHEEVKDFFSELLEAGQILWAVGNCDNCDPIKGCLGHEIPEVVG